MLGPLLLLLPAVLSFQTMQVYHGSRKSYLDLKEVTETKFRQYYPYTDANVLDSFDYVYHDNSRVQREYLKSVEHHHLVNTRLHFCFLQADRMEAIL